MVVKEEGVGEGDVMVMDPPPNPSNFDPMALKRLGPTTSTVRKATRDPWFAQARLQGCAREPPLFVGSSHTHISPQWVFRRLVRCLIRRSDEGKGVWKKDADRGGGLDVAIPLHPPLLLLLLFLLTLRRDE